MRIVHIGEYYGSAALLAEAQRGEGHAVEHVPLLSRERVLSETLIRVEEALATPWDVVHVHHSSLVWTSAAAPGLAQLLHHLLPSISDRSAVAHQLYDASFPIQLLEHLSRPRVGVVASRLDSFNILPSRQEALFVPPPVSIGPWENRFEADPIPTDLRVLSVDDDDPEGDVVPPAVGQLRAKGLRFRFQRVERTEVPDRAALRDLLRGFDIVVEHVCGAPFGLVAGEALALGKAVVSGKPVELTGRWEPAQLSPILHCTVQSIASRLESLVREPKSLRDLGRRGRHFAESYLSIESVRYSIAQLYSHLGARG